LKIFITIILVLSNQMVLAIGGKGPLELTKTSTKNEKPYYMDQVGIDEHLGDQIDLNLGFVDEGGNDVKLGNYFGKKPVFLMLIYYTCPTLCSLHFSNLMKTFKNFEWDIGDKFEFVAVSIDPRETPKDANLKLKTHFGEYARPGTRNGWHFLTGSSENIEKLASQIGFRYFWDESMSQWAHTAAAYVLTPKGKISFYHYGLNIPPKDLRLSLVEASDNKIGNVVDRILLFCMQYDPTKKKYAFYAYNIMSVAAAFMGLIMIFFLGRFWYKERNTEI
jgi:protein SCO1/2